MEKGDKIELMIRIDAFIKGHLSEAEKASFVQEMASDSSLSEQVARQRLHLEALELMLAQDLRTKMTAWDMEEEANNKTSNFWKMGGWALCFVAVLGTLFFLFKPKKETFSALNQNINQKDSAVIKANGIQKTQPDDTLDIKPKPTIQEQKTPNRGVNIVLKSQKPIAEVRILTKDILENAQEDLAIVLTELEKNHVQRGKEMDSVLLESYRSIRQKDYKKAENILKSTANTEGVFTRAIVYFLDGQYTQAATIFENLRNNDGFDHSETAEYYAALCLLANQQKQAAVRRLTKIANDNEHQYSNKAKMNLRQL